MVFFEERFLASLVKTLELEVARMVGGASFPTLKEKEGGCTHERNQVERE